MTKYVLNSGGVRNYPDRAKKFFAEVVKGLGSSPKILVCCFAQPREDWENNFLRDQSDLPNFFPEEMTPTFELAMPDTFESQIRNSDAVYMHGGDDHLLMYWLRKFDIPKIWDGKVVATSSASSDALSTHFFASDWRKAMDGLGILPIKFIPHYGSSYGADNTRGPVNWQKGYEELKNYKDTTLPVYAMAEGEYVVIEK